MPLIKQKKTTKNKSQDAESKDFKANETQKKNLEEKQNYLTKEETDIFIKAFLSYSVFDDDYINELNENLEEQSIDKDNEKPIKTREG